MTLIEVIFALFIFAGVGAGSTLALSSTVLGLRHLEQIRTVHDAMDIATASWFANHSLPNQISVDGMVCSVSEKTEDEGVTQVEVRLGNFSQDLWLPPAS